MSMEYLVLEAMYLAKLSFERQVKVKRNLNSRCAVVTKD
jgi:hypothetical protein